MFLPEANLFADGLRRNLPDDAETVGATFLGGAIEIAARVHRQIAAGQCPIVAFGEVVKVGIGPTAS